MAYAHIDRFGPLRILSFLLLLMIDFVDCVPMGYQTLGMIGASTTHTTDITSQKPCSEERLDLTPFSEFPECDWTQLELLASPMVQNLRDTTPHNPLAIPHGTAPIKPSERA